MGVVGGEGGQRVLVETEQGEQGDDRHGVGEVERALLVTARGDI